ncbi:neoverrucotoxin subunit beta-like [Epinephelus fuscoguttatus]|uniref:neoverrucotoxin subunit beta-like n=1 Tax=Epinephelus fuscoguttatus TaxID=293821 RepID=UPI0020D1111F|nr:neoverrucotoxin subunit beta-like [Epinephelus fuscoguttatus]
MASDQITVAALGRPFTLGMLYDARKDELIPGMTLWEEKTLEEHTTENLQHSSDFVISASDSIESKSSLLDIEASLRASFLCGLVEVGGSAKYLNDEKKFKNQSRVTGRFKATTSFKQLSVNHLGAVKTQDMDVIKKGMATHVVTGIQYGANAVFVFDSEKLEDNSVQDIQGSMEAVIKKIPSFDVKGRVDIKLTDEEKTLTNKFSCKFYGDFILDSNPATFEDAVKTYVQLPQLLEKNGENSVPVKVWLMPLKNFDLEAADLMCDISVGLVWKAQDALEDLREMRMRCNDSLEDRVVENFPQIQEGLRTFQKLCGYYESNLQQTMAKKLLAIREGKEDESSIAQLFEDRDKSPFSHEKLSKWLLHKEREINVIRSSVDMMKGIKIVPNQSGLDREVLAPGVDDALCFVFTSLGSIDPCLDVLTNYLNSPELSITNEDPWYFSDDVFIRMREKAKDFHDLAKAQKKNKRFRFLVAAIANEKYKGATIYRYKEGILDTEDFSKPELPEVETITDRRDLICGMTCGEWQTYPDCQERFDVHTQVLCYESLNRRHYWEVEFSQCPKESNYVAVAYKEIERKSGSSRAEFGNNTVSWAFGQCASPHKHLLRAWHNGEVWHTPFPSGGCSRVGVYLDQPAGTLSFYKVSSNTLSHLYTFRTTFTEPVYPGLWVYHTNNFGYLRPVE